MPKHFLRDIIRLSFNLNGYRSRNVRHRCSNRIAPKKWLQTFELLEDRLTPSSWIVNLASPDSGMTAGTLRYALTNAVDNDTITFDSGLMGSTITLSSVLPINQNVSIVGLGAANLTVSGGGTVGVFSVTTGVTASISGLTIANGHVTGNGGGIDNAGTLTLTDDAFTGNTATGNGADISIANGGILNAGNTSAFAGANINVDGTLNLSGSSITIGSLTGSGTVTNNLLMYQIDNGIADYAFNNTLIDEAEDNWVGNVFTAATGGTVLNSITFKTLASDLNNTTLPYPSIQSALYMGSPSSTLTLVPGSVNSVVLNSTAGQFVTVPFATPQYVSPGQLFTAALLIDGVPILPDFTGIFPFAIDNSGISTNSYFDVSSPLGNINSYNLAAPNGPTLNGAIYGSSGSTNISPGVTMLRVNQVTPAATLTVAGGGSFSGVVQDGSGILGLIVAGTSKTLTLTGTSTYTNLTTINNSNTLIVNGSILSSVIVSTGATLGGTGSVGILSVSGIINPGSPIGSVGTLTAASANFSAGGKLNVNVTGGVGNVTRDQLVLTGALTLGGTSGVILDFNGLTVPNAVVPYFTFASRTGQFSSGSILNNPNGYQPLNTYAATSVSLTVFPRVTANAANLINTATSMTIAGFGFATTPANNSVSFDNGVTGTITAATNNSLTVSLTGLAAVANGTLLKAIVTVHGVSNSAAVTVATVRRLPAIGTLTPNNGPVAGSTSVIIAGNGFSGATLVKFGPSNAVSFVVNSDSQITATSPAGTGTVDVTVTTAIGISANTVADDFTYIPAPSAPSVTVNGGHSIVDVQPSGFATFSRIITLELTFNTAITSIAAGAFTLFNGTDTVTNNGDIAVAGVGTTMLTLTFTGTNATPGVEYFSLADGIWTLTTDLTKVHNAWGVGTGSGTTNNIRRLFGDVNGTGTVDGGDFGLFGSTFGLNDQDPSFNAQFDVNADGSINGGDFGPFGSRFGTGL